MAVTFRREDRLMGWLLFVRSQPHHFSEHDRRLALGIGDLAKAAVERIRLQSETVDAKEEADFLYKLAEQINAATSYQAVLDAVVHLFPDFDGVYLNLCEHFDYERASYFDIPVAANIPENLQHIVGMRLPKTRFPLADQLQDQRLFVIENVETDPRVDETSRANWKVTGTHSLIIAPFHREGRLFGWLFFNSSKPRHFSERDLRLALGIGDLAKAAVERIHLQQETIESKNEADLLYKLAEQINGATSYQAVLDAVVRLMPDFEGVFLNLYQYFDYDRASYYEVPVAANIPDHLKWMVGQRVPKANYPAAEQFRNQRLVVIEDVENDPRVDEISRSNTAQTGTRSMMFVTFHREGRLFGWLFFNSSKPRHFSERDLRLALGIGDLAKAAIERIHLQQETITARQRAEILAGLNAEFSRAVNEIDLLRAFVPYAGSIGAYRVEMAYAEHFRGDDSFASYLIALWMNGDYTDYRQPGHQPRHVRSHQYLLGGLWLPHPDQVIYSEDIENDIRLDEEQRVRFKQQFNMGAAVILPLIHAGEFQGLISINWSEAHQFSEDERFILEQLLQTLPAVIATRRIYLSEQEARAENELLYTVGKDINRAKTDYDVMMAVSLCFPEPLYVAIFMWENYDRNKASYSEVVISTDSECPAGTRLPRNIFDLSEADNGKTQVIDDVHAPQWAGHLAAASAGRFGAASVAFTNLAENQQVVGVFTIGCRTQRNFTDREIRLMSGVSDLTGAALERFRLRDETEQARQRAHDLAALEERTRLARELHDSVSQALYGIGLGAQTAFRSLDKNPLVVRESIEYVLTLAAAGLAEM
ncbi:MAG: GAF domain-containing protein, partial [Chloroflexota bacterium]